MKKLISEKFVKQSIIKWLFRSGWGRNLEVGELRDQGVDIRVKNNKVSRFFLIETKGEGKTRQVSESTFVHSLGQIITRMKTGGTTRYYYGLGLPELSAKIALRRIPWQIAKKLYLIILSVNQREDVIEYDWTSLKKFQNKKLKN
ncbi:MAG: hypothetical protein COX44_01190 [Candidatus Portnoybacteria bacterium CG23_combo_of_CG06-09_8_20_14_all_37_13]|uniref:Uncharacterized protein n=1 Tax=Candidatus Portnoybacteria bacterium CG23_combo_of_CG06-09_8_20_14_all_37_13 TaxID=1974819 RepID=A0A2G9YD88_9BACT|nr:MAG: hypothetical protein COX44_01190 [Candidatus Portnoybacteria bacterium CG23_combo_of_CG06-09_8_20_14_all_37_13]